MLPELMLLLHVSILPPIAREEKRTLQIKEKRYFFLLLYFVVITPKRHANILLNEINWIVHEGFFFEASSAVSSYERWKEEKSLFISFSTFFFFLLTHRDLIRLNYLYTAVMCSLKRELNKIAVKITKWYMNVKELN